MGNTQWLIGWAALGTLLLVGCSAESTPEPTTSVVESAVESVPSPLQQTDPVPASQAGSTSVGSPTEKAFGATGAAQFGLLTVELADPPNPPSEAVGQIGYWANVCLADGSLNAHRLSLAPWVLRNSAAIEVPAAAGIGDEPRLAGNGPLAPGECEPGFVNFRITDAFLSALPIEVVFTDESGDTAVWNFGD